MLKPLGTDFGIPIRSMVSPVSVPINKTKSFYMRFGKFLKKPFKLIIEGDVIEQITSVYIFPGQLGLPGTRNHKQKHDVPDTANL